ncbi:hypothetical protein EVAR_24303_1 [Eumeta japonica]|uniref:Uncharacterized protein n=1 Tax=Eumeta variegata TaxID=151549 RepID=A0A4C1VL35_EUMVA|nr:hypothetical protein EVAR_24303_1 [Eumeta japonica]
MSPFEAGSSPPYRPTSIKKTITAGKNSVSSESHSAIISGYLHAGWVTEAALVVIAGVQISDDVISESSTSTLYGNRCVMKMALLPDIISEGRTTLLSKWSRDSYMVSTSATLNDYHH